MSIAYPQSPVLTSDDFTRPGKELKTGIARVAWSLVLFAIMYLLLFAAAVAMAVALAFAGGAVVLSVANLWAIVFGAGLIITGGMVLYFLVKFIFERKRQDKDLLEIKEQDYPELFQFIRQLNQETGTDFPKHIYISQEVNAAVFYDSTFLSMFFPVRKNLLIGIGMANMVNLSEFKAVIAHEFGHFSQNLRAGSYVYQVNKAIYNMLYENKNYNELLIGWARIHFIFSLCARLTLSLVKGIQAIQRYVYTIVNKQYNALSRQMEFHADAIAAKAAGSNNLVSALKRIEFADTCYNAALEQYNNWVDQSIRGENIFSAQRIVARALGEIYRLPTANGLPVAGEEKRFFQYYTKVSIEDIWASHPTLSQRVDALNSINVLGEVADESPWVLFGNAEKLQHDLTDKLYKAVKFEREPEVGGDRIFAAAYQPQPECMFFPKIYDFYFRNRSISQFDTSKEPPQTVIADLAAFFTENTSLNMRKKAVDYDIDLLKKISANKKIVRTFNFDGENYKSHYAETILQTLEMEAKKLTASLAGTDETVGLYFLRQAKNAGEDAYTDLKKRYDAYFSAHTYCLENVAFCDHLLALAQPCYGKKYLPDKNVKMAWDLQDAAGLIGKRLEKIPEKLPETSQKSDYGLPENIVTIAQKRLTFLDGDQFNNNEIAELYHALHAFANWSTDQGFTEEKRLLEFQLKYVNH